MMLEVDASYETARCMSTLLFGIKVPFRDAGQGSMEGHTVGRDQSPKLILDPYPVSCSPPPQASSILHRTSLLVS
jgi:hypothetical protein